MHKIHSITYWFGKTNEYAVHQSNKSQQHVKFHRNQLSTGTEFAFLYQVGLNESQGQFT